jgi:hypothetical protein
MVVILLYLQILAAFVPMTSASFSIHSADKNSCSVHSTDISIALKMTGQIDQTAAIAALRQAIEQTSPYAQAQMLFCSDFTLQRKYFISVNLDIFEFLMAILHNVKC